MPEQHELARRFAYHRPETTRCREAHASIRDLHRNLALDMNDLLPECREKSLALTAIQEAMMWANAAIAIHGTVDTP